MPSTPEQGVSRVQSARHHSTRGEDLSRATNGYGRQIGRQPSKSLERSKVAPESVSPKSTATREGMSSTPARSLSKGSVRLAGRQPSFAVDKSKLHELEGSSPTTPRSSMRVSGRLPEFVVVPDAGEDSANNQSKDLPRFKLRSKARSAEVTTEQYRRQFPVTDKSKNLESSNVGFSNSRNSIQLSGRLSEVWIRPDGSEDCENISKSSNVNNSKDLHSNSDENLYTKDGAPTSLGPSQSTRPTIRRMHSSAIPRTNTDFTELRLDVARITGSVSKRLDEFIVEKDNDIIIPISSRSSLYIPSRPAQCNASLENTALSCRTESLGGLKRTSDVLGGEKDRMQGQRLEGTGEDTTVQQINRKSISKQASLRRTPPNRVSLPRVSARIISFNPAD